MPIETTRRCSRCKDRKPVSEFSPTIGKLHHKKYFRSQCRSCHSLTVKEQNYSKGINSPMDKNPACASYLGIHIAERILSKYFDGIVRMPLNTPGYDFVCKKGFKIDVKSACLRSVNRSFGWDFSIKRNITANYFLLLAFNSRESLDPMHVWLIPGEVINQKVGFWIKNTEEGISRWSKWERPLDKVIYCCDKMKAQEAAREREQEMAGGRG